jgi:hypothetical protein
MERRAASVPPRAGNTPDVAASSSSVAPPSAPRPPSAKEEAPSSFPPQGASWGRMFSLYATWLVFGLFGGHHVLLARYEQAILYGQTLGLFGVGWAADFFLLPHYQARVDGLAPGGVCGGRGGCLRWIVRFAISRVHGLVATLVALAYAVIVEALWVYPYTGPTSGTVTAPTREIKDDTLRWLAYAAMSAAAASGATLVGGIGASSAPWLWAFAGAFLPLMGTDGGPPGSVGSATPFSGSEDDLNSSDAMSAAVIAALGAVIVGGLFTKEDAVKPQRLPRASALRRCCGCCGVTLSVVLFWLSLPLLLVLHGEMRVNPRTGKYDAAGLGTTYLGPYALRNGKEVWAEAERLWEEVKRCVRGVAGGAGRMRRKHTRGGGGLLPLSHLHFSCSLSPPHPSPAGTATRAGGRA